jgi:hypothetical protein
VITRKENESNFVKNQNTDQKNNNNQPFQNNNLTQKNPYIENYQQQVNSNVNNFKKPIEYTKAIEHTKPIEYTKVIQQLPPSTTTVNTNNFVVRSYANYENQNHSQVHVDIHKNTKNDNQNQKQFNNLKKLNADDDDAITSTNSLLICLRLIAIEISFVALPNEQKKAKKIKCVQINFNLNKKQRKENDKLDEAQSSVFKTFEILSSIADHEILNVFLKEDWFYYLFYFVSFFFFLQH